MAIANKTRWMEKWLCGGAMQVVSCRIVEDKNYNESTVVTIKAMEPVKAPQAPTMILRDPIPVKDLLAKLDADRARALAK